MSVAPEKAAIMLFARVPIPGKVKTRLIPELGAVRACRLHQAMLACGLEALAQSSAQSRQLWLAGECRARAGDLLALERGLSLHWQQGADIGERMAWAFQHNFSAGFGRVIVAGSDCPQLTAGHYEQVLGALRQYDAAIIPALDGGYVVLGLRRWGGFLFSDVPWGTEEVFRITVAKLEAVGWRWCALPPLPDIDQARDLVHLEGLGLDY